MGTQLDIFKEAERSRYKRYYDNFYKGVRKRYEMERRTAQNDLGMTISIKHGLVPIRKIIKSIK